MDPAVQLLSYILTLLLMISAQFGIHITDIAENARLEDEMIAIIRTEEERLPMKPFPDILYPSETDEVALGPWRITVRSAITDMHCDWCSTFTKQIRVHLYVRHTEGTPLSFSDIVTVHLLGTYNEAPASWNGSLYAQAEAGITESEYVDFEVPLEATDFTFVMTTCDPNDRWDFSCDRALAPAQPITVRVHLGNPQ